MSSRLRGYRLLPTFVRCTIRLGDQLGNLLLQFEQRVQRCKTTLDSGSTGTAERQ